MYGICFIQNDYRHLWGRTDDSLNTRTCDWRTAENGDAMPKTTDLPYTSAAEFTARILLPPGSSHPHRKWRKARLRCDGVTELQLCLSRRPWEEKVTRQQKRMQNYQLWVPRSPVIQWQVPELRKQNTKDTNYTMEWHPKEVALCPKAEAVHIHKVSFFFFPECNSPFTFPIQSTLTFPYLSCPPYDSAVRLERFLL